MHVGRTYTPRVNEGGNFCGHAPDAPRLELSRASTLKARPRVLAKLQQEVRQYYRDPSRLPSLNAANKSKRQQRSERREACLLALTAILEFTDLTSLRCGIPTREGFVSLTIDYLVKFTGMGMRRMERAIADLKNGNILTIAQPRQLNEDGSWRGLAAVKAVNRHLFTAFGLARWLKHERDRAAARLQKKTKKLGGTLTEWARNHLVVHRVLRTTSGPRQVQEQTSRAGSDVPLGIDREAYLRARAELLIALHEQRQGLNAEELNKEVDRLIKGRFTA